jgi:hypothetical protein
MAALIIYSLWRKRQSAREIAESCRDDLGAMVITGGRQPSQSTIDQFISPGARKGAASASWSPCKQRGEDAAVVKFPAQARRSCLVRAQCDNHGFSVAVLRLSLRSSKVEGGPARSAR